MNISERKCSMFFGRTKCEGDIFSLMVTKIRRTIIQTNENADSSSVNSI